MPTRPVHVVTVFLVVAVLAGSCFLSSSGRGEIEGARPWAPGSLLRPLALALNFDYQAPTPLGIAIKNLVLGLGSAGAILLAAIAWSTGPGRQPGPGNDPDAGQAGEPLPSATTRGRSASMLAALRRPMSPTTGAQLLVVVFVAWSFLSGRWSHARPFALYGSVWMAIPMVWAIGLGRGLTARTARAAAIAMVVVCALTAALAVWYFYERNPSRRAAYPIGQPLSLAACMIPGVLLAVAAMAAGWRRIRQHPSAPAAAALAALALAVAAMLWAFLLTGSPGPLPAAEAWWSRLGAYLATRSRGPAAGMAIGLATLGLLGLRGRGKLLIASVLLAGLAVGGFWLLPRMTAVEAYARGATARLRLYAWSYALNMVAARPLRGFGQGGYALLADSMAAGDVDRDPEPFGDTRLAHAHNEWLEVAADLGSIGFAVLGGVYGLSLLAGVVTLRQMRNPVDRWCLMGLLASLVGLIVEEMTDVALRLPGLPALHYTVLGLLWAICLRADEPESGGRAPAGKALRGLVVLGAAGIALALVSLSYRDWRGARAQADLRECLRNAQWTDALALGKQAAQSRLNPVRRLAANRDYLWARYHVARVFYTAWRERRGRLAAGEQENRRLAALAEQDRRQAHAHARAGIELAEQLRRWAPACPGVGLTLAELRGMIADIERQRGGAQVVAMHRQRARDALLEEYRRRRFDEQVALRLWQLSRHRPLAEQVEILSGPLRFGWVSGELPYAVAELARSKGFDAGFAAIVARARRALQVQSPRDWPDPHAPEKLRLRAMVLFVRRAYRAAAEAAGEAIELFARTRGRLRWAALASRVERSRYLFLADPQRPAAAIEEALHALQDVPATASAETVREMILEQLLLYRLAAGQEEQARRLVEQLGAGPDEQAIQTALGLAYVRLAKTVVRYEPSRKPTLWARWIERAAQLAPDRFEVQMALGGLELRRGRDGALAEALKRASALAVSPAQQRAVDALLDAALSRFPRSAALQAFRASRRAARQGGSRPATQGTAPDATGRRANTAATKTTAPDPSR